MDVSINDRFYNEKIKALSVLTRVIDPELFINIVDLGLVYDISFGEEGNITVTMTLSTPHCPLGDAITSGVRNAMNEGFPGTSTEVVLVWEPRWNFSMLSEEGKKLLGVK